MEGNSIFSMDDADDLFAPVNNEEDKVKKPSSLFSLEDDDDEPIDNETDELETDTPDGEEDVETQEEEEEEEEKPRLGRKPKVKPTVFGEAIQTLIQKTDEFLVWDGEDSEGVPFDKKINYSEEEFVELISQNINTKVEATVESVLTNVLENLSPSIRKVVTGELKGVKIKDILSDLQEYQEIEEIPDDPTDEQKERIVKKYYQKLAKELGKDSNWVSAKLERTIDREELDDEFKDAKDVLGKELDKKIAEKEEAEEKKVLQKIEFKKTHAHYVNEVLREENIFGIKLSKEQKNQVANVLASYVTRETDKKEKMGLTALIDDLIHSDNKKESYKRLVMMTLSAVAPDKFIASLKQSGESQANIDTFKKLKTADKSNPVTIQPKKTVPVYKTKSVLG